MKRCLPSALFAVLLMLANPGAIARDTGSGGFPDTPLARTQVLALLQTLNADLLSHDSATLTLERWCSSHNMASPALVVADRVRGADKALPPDLRAQLGAAVGDAVKYRHVRLSCGGHVLSEADNWYLPGRLTPAMNQQLGNSDVPFGKVVKPLHFRRRTLSAQLLWSPLPEGWEMHAAEPTSAAGRLVIPDRLLQHRALLVDGDSRPFSALVETYTSQVLAFSRAAPTTRHTPLQRPSPASSTSSAIRFDVRQQRTR